MTFISFLFLLRGIFNIWGLCQSQWAASFVFIPFFSPCCCVYKQQNLGLPFFNKVLHLFPRPFHAGKINETSTTGLKLCTFVSFKESRGYPPCLFFKVLIQKIHEELIRHQTHCKRQAHISTGVIVRIHVHKSYTTPLITTTNTNTPIWAKQTVHVFLLLTVYPPPPHFFFYTSHIHCNPYHAWWSK